VLLLPTLDRFPELSRNRLNYRGRARGFPISAPLSLAETTVTGQSSRYAPQTVNYLHFFHPLEVPTASIT